MSRYEKTKRYLSQLRFIDYAIKKKTHEMKQLRDFLENTSVELKADRVQSSGSADRLGDSVAKIVDLEKETIALVAKYALTQKTINEHLDDLSKPEYSMILHLKYFGDKKLYEIGKELGYDENYIRKLHGRALKEFESRFSSTYEN